MALMLVVANEPAQSAQILVNPGDDWEAKAARARPGDVVILMPGRHRPATFDRLVGTRDAPITIRGASPDKPAQITGQLDGIRIKEGAHLVIRDVQVTGGSASGVWIGAAQPDGDSTTAIRDAAAPAEPGTIATTKPRSVKARDILIENVSISRVGPRGQRHGLYLCGFVDARIVNVRVEGWGGSAIELVGCEDVSILRCLFRGMEDHSQHCGVRTRAGCDRISISECRFENAGDFAVSFGGKSNPEEYVPPIPPDAPNASITEASRVQVEQSVIIGSVCAAAFIHADSCLVRTTTIVRPRRCVFAILTESPDIRVKPTGRNIFGSNLVYWQAGDLARLVEISKGLDGKEFVCESNLWWSTETAEQREKLGGLPGSQPDEQVHGVDPRLDGDLKPTNPAARSFGAV